jgi:cytochrome c oxidase subunit 2
MDDIDSYMINTKDITFGNHRLLNVDNIINSKLNFPTRLIVSGNDVIHSFTIPQLGLKVDGIPGKLNQTFFNILRPGTYYGQCSEICGAEHSFMPIKLTTV